MPASGAFDVPAIHEANRGRAGHPAGRGGDCQGIPICDKMEAHPMIQDTLVVVLPDARWGEIVVALYQDRDGKFSRSPKEVRPPRSPPVSC